MLLKCLYADDDELQRKYFGMKLWIAFDFWRAFNSLLLARNRHGTQVAARDQWGVAEESEKFYF